MAKLYFTCSSMNSGKSTTLLQNAFNYEERGMDVMIFNFHGDTRMGSGTVNSRIGISAPANLYSPETNIFNVVKAEQKSIKCIFVDEAQFLTKEQVWQLSDVVDKLEIPVLTFGLRTDFQGEPFEGSKYLLSWADEIRELRGICFCGKKATFVLRKDSQGNVVTDGDQISIGGEEQYVSVCRRHYKQAMDDARNEIK
ncbi:thymidine kinase [Vibrio sp. D431a]|uniref:thymidine kinase n=1 Tax=Vibrio sp. D431a TaxID=2837388 RepID=UPI0025556060|nr:thymidine kinase [Vibrio sp. D431a]MDK9790695.1 thymidine kinase [Vibrio sp. D431a]